MANVWPTAWPGEVACHSIQDPSERGTWQQEDEQRLSTGLPMHTPQLPVPTVCPSLEPGMELLPWHRTCNGGSSNVGHMGPESLLHALVRATAAATTTAVCSELEPELPHAPDQSRSCHHCCCPVLWIRTSTAAALAASSCPSWDLT